MKVSNMVTSLLAEPLATRELMFINICAFIFIVMHGFYLEVRHRNNYSNWKVAKEMSLKNIHPNVRVYMKAILRARQVLEKNWELPPLLVLINHYSFDRTTRLPEFIAFAIIFFIVK